MLSAETPRTKVKAFFLPVNRYGGGMYIWGPAPVGPALGVTDVMTKKRRFSAQIAFQFRISLNSRRDTIAISCE